ncbi:MAG: HEAT repeat domain-containing protein [Polyangiales bacterium]
MPTADEIQNKIEQLQHAEEEVRRLQDELIDDAETARGPLLAAIKETIIVGLGHGEGPEAAAALVPITEVLGELEGPDVCDALIDVLGSDEPEVRFVAGRALQDLAFDRFKEVAEAAERAIKRLPGDSHALRELPFVVAEVAEPGVPKILRGWLAHKSAEVVAAAIEALAALGDPAAIPELAKLVRDPRTVMLEDDAEEGTQAAIGALADEAIAMIEETSPPPAPPPQQRHNAPGQRGPGGKPQGGRRR